MALTFAATLQADGGMFFEVPTEIMTALAGGKRPAVRVVVNGVVLRTTIAVYGGRSYIGVRREIRDAANVKLGDEVELSVELADWVLSARRRETREQRVAEAPGLLKSGRRTPLSSR